LPISSRDYRARRVGPRPVRARLEANVRRLRVEKGWSQEDYADRAGIRRTYVSDIELERKNPTITIVEKLARALKGRRVYAY